MFRCKSCGAFNRVGAGATGTSPVCGKCKQSLDVSGAPQEVDAEMYARAVASSPVPVLVDLWAPWCPPCRAAGPILDRIARKTPGEYLTLKVNTQEHPAVADQLGVSGIPTFVMFRDGREANRLSGLLPEPAFDKWIQEQLHGSVRAA